MEMEAVIAVIETKLKEIKSDTTEIRDCLFGNGHKGLKNKGGYSGSEILDYYYT